MAELYSFGSHGFKNSFGLLRYYYDEDQKLRTDKVIKMNESLLASEKSLFLTFCLTEANPPLFSSERQPLKTDEEKDPAFQMEDERPPITVSLTVDQFKFLLLSLESKIFTSANMQSGNKKKR